MLLVHKEKNYSEIINPIQDKGGGEKVPLPVFPL